MIKISFEIRIAYSFTARNLNPFFLYQGVQLKRQQKSFSGSIRIFLSESPI